MPSLTENQQYWESLYLSLKNQQASSQAVVQNTTAIAPELRTDAQNRDLEIAQRSQITAENRLQQLQGDINAQLQSNIGALDRTLANTPTNAPNYAFLVDQASRVKDSIAQA